MFCRVRSVDAMLQPQTRSVEFLTRHHAATEILQLDATLQPKTRSVEFLTRRYAATEIFNSTPRCNRKSIELLKNELFSLKMVITLF